MVESHLPAGTFLLHVHVSSYVFFSFGKKCFICILPVFTCLALFLKYGFKSQRYVLFREACFSKLKVRL